jgi:hypothetical protein
MENGGNNANETRLPDSILLAAASAMSYAVAYAYRIGFGSFYDLPPLLLTPTIGGILKAGAAVGATLLTLSFFLNGIWMFLPSRNSALGRSIRRILLVLVFVILSSFSLFVYRWGWLVVPAALLVMTFLELVFPLITQRNIARYEDKLAAQEKVESAVTMPVDHFARRIGKRSFLLVFASYVLVNFSHSLGYIAAKQQEEFFVPDDAANYVVAAMDDEIAVMVAYDRGTMTLKRSYEVRRVGSTATKWHKWKLGRLKEALPAEQLTEDSCPDCI